MPASSALDSISNIGAIEIHVMNSVGVRYVDACSNNLLMVMMDAAPTCVGNLPLVRYFKVAATFMPSRL